MSSPRFSPSRRARRGAIAGVIFAVVVVAMIVLIQDRRRTPAPPAREIKSPRIVSLLPQATDILQSIGCGDHLAAVTGYDADPAVANLPRVGDYQTTDWEMIASLHPAWIITHYGQGRTPAGFTQHADAIGAKQLNLETETLNGPDPKLTIYYAIEALGKAVNEPQKAADASARLRARLEKVGARVAGRPRVSTLIVIGAEGTMVAGKRSYLSELLEIAGASNAAAGFDDRYPQLDREQILALRPEVILQLLPDASPQVTIQAQKFWTTLGDIPAVKNNRIKQLTGWYVMLPGYHVGEVAEEFADAVHPAAAGGAGDFHHGDTETQRRARRSAR